MRASRDPSTPRAGSPAADVALVVFDVDGTLVEHSDSMVVWQLLNRRFGEPESVGAARFRDFLERRLTYAEWVRLDIECWMEAGATRAEIEDVIRTELALAPNAREVVHEIARRGYRLAVVSGTLDIVLHTLFPDHPFEFVFVNKIRFHGDGTIEGWEATPYDMDGKAAALHVLSRRTGVAADRIAFVGDHVNDCSALSFVGCPIAYDPKHERVREMALHVVPRGQMRGLLDILPARRRAP